MADPDETDQALAKAASNQARIARALAPGRVLADLVKAIQPPFPTVAEIAKAMQPPAHLSALSQAMAAMQRQHLLFADLSRPPRLLADVTRQMVQMQALSQRITAPSLAIQEIVRSQSAVFDGISSRVAALDSLTLSVPQFAQMTLAWNVASIGLANRMNDIGLLARRAQLSARLFEAPSAYAAFARQTTERLASAPSPENAASLRGSLNLAEHQLLGIADAVSAFIVMPDDAATPDDVRVLNAPFVQQEELLASVAVHDENDIEAMTIVSTAAQTARCGRRVLALVIQCNEAGKTSAYGVEIFKPTTRLMTVFSDLPWLAATDQSSFADVVDCLYFVFYEGAGGDRLRFLDKQGGPLVDADCDLIWCIKHLRNKWSRHDADHGSERDIRKSWTELAAKFRWLGLSDYPTDDRHFLQLHHQLLFRAEEFLLRILSGLKLRH